MTDDDGGWGKLKNQGKVSTTLQVGSNARFASGKKTQKPNPDLHGREVLVPEALAVTRLMGGDVVSQEG